jgi:murein tripeptide amidase MpaA
METTMKIRCISCLVAILGCAMPAVAQDEGPARFDGHAVVRAKVDSVRTLQTMLALSPDCWSESIGIGSLDFRMPPGTMDALRASGIEFEVLIKDVQVLIDAENAWHETHPWSPEDQDTVEGGLAGEENPFFDDYRRTNDIHAYLEGLMATYPDLITRELAGSSVEGRPIWAYVITAPTDNLKAGICINGMQHAREWISPMTCCWLMTELLENYDSNAEVANLLDDLEWHMIPVLNPDGYEHSWDDYRLWRKNRFDNGDGTFGVDLNRNWDANWGGDGASGNTNSDVYYGTAPFSEPETRAIRDWINDHPNISAHVDVHSYSQLMLYSYGYVDGIPEGADGTCLESLAVDMVDAIYTSEQKSYTPQPAHDLYIASGTAQDWTYDGANCLSYTIELRDTGEYGFILPADQIRPTGIENFLAFRRLGNAVRDRLYVALPGGWPGGLEAGSPTAVVVDIAQTWDRTGSIASASVRYRVNGGSLESTTMSDDGGGRYTATIPAVECGDVVTSFIEVIGASGSTSTWPTNGDTLDSIGQESTVFFIDNFEEDLGWSVANDADLADGAFERGLPLGGGDRGDPASDYDGSGQLYGTNLLDGNTDVDGGGTELTSPLLDGSQPGSELVYARFFSNNNGGAPFQDVMTVEISGDGGGSWSTLEVIGPDGQEAAGGWYQKRWSLNDVPGIGESAQVRVRFRAEDINDGSVVEAAVDDVRIEVSDCAPGIPGDLDGDGTVDGMDLSTLLGNWGLCGPPCPADLNGDGRVDGVDLSTMLGNWG